MRMYHLTTILLIGALVIDGMLNLGPAAASPAEQLADLTGKASVSVTFTGRDNFNSEYRYDLTVRNRSSEPLIAVCSFDRRMISIGTATNSRPLNR